MAHIPGDEPTLQPVIPSAPLPVFQQMEIAEQNAAVDAVNTLMKSDTLPSSSRDPHGKSAPLAALDISTELRGKLYHARKDGYGIPYDTVRKKPGEVGENPYRFVYPSGKTNLPVVDPPSYIRYMQDHRNVFIGWIIASFILGAIVFGIVSGILGGVGASTGTAENIGTGMALIAMVPTFIFGSRFSWRYMEMGGSPHLTVSEAEELIGALRKFRGTAPSYSDDSEIGRVVRAAEHLMSQLTASKAWRSDYLDLAHTLFQPDSELKEIRDHAGKIHSLSVKQGDRPQGESDEAAIARRHYDHQKEILHQVQRSLIRRVAALYVYAQLMDDLSEKITNLERIQSSLDLAPELEDLVAQLGSDDVAMRNYRLLIADADEVRGKIIAITGFIAQRGAVEG